MRLTVDVTAEDIAQGRRRKANSCPIALATVRAYLKKTGVKVTVCATPNRIVVYHSADCPANRESGRTTNTAASFMNDFDRSKAVPTITFVVDLQ